MINFIAKTSENIHLITHAENLVVKTAWSFSVTILLFKNVKRNIYLLAHYGFTDIKML